MKDVIHYAEIWAIYKQHPHYRAGILSELDLESWLPYASANIQAYVLDNCPDEILKALERYIKERAKIKLGLVHHKVNYKILC